MLLRVETDNERGDIDYLLSYADVTLADQDTGVVDGLGKTKLVDLGLETAFQKVLDAESQDVIELHTRVVKDTDADETANEGVTLEETFGVLFVEGQELTGSTTVGVSMQIPHDNQVWSHTESWKV